METKYLSKPDTVLIFKPDSYNIQQKYPLVYLLHGYIQNYSQLSETVNLQYLANRYAMIIITPDGFDSWYVNSPLDTGSIMEDFFFKDLVPKVHQALNIDEKYIFINGLGMGGYGALRYFILHNDYFNAADSSRVGLKVNFEELKEISLLFFNNTRVTDDLSRLFGNQLQTGRNQYSISEV